MWKLKAKGTRRLVRRRVHPGHVALVLALAAGALAPGMGATASASPIDDKRAEASRIQDTIDANGERISILAENYNEARLKIDEATAGIVDAQTRLDAAAAESRRLSDILQGRAAQLYMKSGSSSPIPELDAHSISEAGSRAKYSSAAAARDESVIDDLSIARELLDSRKADLEKLKAEAEAESARLDQSRAEVEAAQAEQQRTLSQLNGEIADLVHQEDVRRQQEADRRAREELTRRQAAAAAARQTAADSGPSSGSGSASGSNTPTPPANVPAPSPRSQIAVDTAKAQLGKPYSYGTAGPSTFDCSGLTMYSWAAAGVSIPHSSRSQFSVLPHVPMDALAPGDIVFFGRPVHHLGMYIGGGQMIHAPQTGDVVKVSPFYRSDYVGAGRPG